MHPEWWPTANQDVRPAGAGGSVPWSLWVLRRTRDRALARNGADDTYTLHTRNAVAAGYVDAGYVEDAEPIFAELVSDCRRVLGPDHPDTLIVEGNLAAVRLLIGQHERALGDLERARAARTGLWGPEHPASLDAGHALGVAQSAVGDAAAARDTLAEVLAIRARVLGARHPDTDATRAELARVASTSPP